MPDPSTASEQTKLTTSGRDETYNSQNNYNIGVSKAPDVIEYITTAAKSFVALVCMNQSSRVNERSGAEISNVIAPDPSPLPVFSIADRYTRSMMECMVGYPLYEPEPFSELSTEYTTKGVNIGDVGLIRADGTFDFLFNICPPQNSLINPPNLPDGFSLSEHPKTKTIRPLAAGTSLFSSAIIQTKSGEYICKGSQGATLVLPEGAVQEEAVNRGSFEELAKRHGVAWYEHTKRRGRSISNGSLYLVTSFTKCSRWGIAVFDRPGDPKQGLAFVSSPPCWKGLGALTTRVAYPSKEEATNQCVFLRGYKIMIRQDIFDNLPAQRLNKGGGGTSLMSRIKKSLAWTSQLIWTTVPTAAKSDAVILHASFNKSPAHPSDLINAELLRQNPKANVAITHDDVWCDLLQENFPKLDYTALETKSRSYTSTIDKHGCVSLKKNIHDERNYALPEAEALSTAGSCWPNISMRSSSGTKGNDSFHGGIFAVRKKLSGAAAST